MLPRFEVVARRRPVRLVVPGTSLPTVAPYAAVVATVAGPAELTLASGDDALTATYDGEEVALRIRTGDTTTQHRSRRHGKPPKPATGLGITLTGPQVTAFTGEHGRWVARARYDLTEDDRADPHDEAWLAGLTAGSSGAVGEVESGAFGQVGLRDLRVVTDADGTPYSSPHGTLLLSASSSGPGPFPTAHTSVWSLDPERLELEHQADLFLRRPDRPGVYGDHASHLVRDGDRWLLATSTWGTFDKVRDPHVGATLAETTADVLTGTHVLDSRSLDLPTTDLRSVGVWDPHLVRDDDLGWLVGFVSATKLFRFHPALATGPDLDTLTLRAAASDRRATEGTTLLRIGGAWRVLASDGRDGRRGQRARFPVFNLDLREVGSLDARYPTNLPWPTVVPNGDRGWLLVSFNGAPYGGPLGGYGSHGAVVIQRAPA